LPDESVFDREALSRRRFLKGTALTAGVVAASPYLGMLEAFAAPPVADNQGILITIFLAGGNDGLNMVAPVGDAAYAALRPVLKIANGHSIGNGFSLHPSLVKLKTRFDEGKVAIVRGVGYQPAELSHFSSADIWMHGWGGATTPTTGWLGRYLDTLPNTAHESLYGVGLHGGVNPHLAGATSHASSLPLNISDAFVDRKDPSDARMYDTLIRLGAGASGLGALGDEYNAAESGFMQLAQRILPAYGFPAQSTDIEEQLVLAANLINANLGIRVIDTALDGFDTHSDQATFHATLLSRLDAAVDGFYGALDPKWKSQVTLMTFSEFGRRAEENGDGGTDHGTAAPLLVIGDHVNGGLHGAQPSLTNLDDDGNVVATVDFRAVYASVLRDWLEADDKHVLGKTFDDLSLFRASPAAPFTASESGYWIAGPSGSVHGLGRGTKFGSIAHLTHPIIAGAATPTHMGMWLATATGGVHCFGDAKPHGSVGGHLGQPIVAMAATPSGKGYWLVTSAGGVHCFGDAKGHGSVGGHLGRPIVAMAATPSGKGYWLVTSAGGVHCFGDARPHGSPAARHLGKPIVAMAATSSGKGYWLVTAGGGVFAYGDAHLYAGHLHTPAPVVAIARTVSGHGYWLAARDGTVGAFGDAPTLGGVKAPTSVLVRC
jgi:uncharacterized protein (DUF1501 family)